MKDSHNRVIDYIRISITDRCNLRCRYCMPEDIPSISHDEIMRFESILRICRLAGSLGIRKFKVTGGEPLVRKGCLPFLKGSAGYRTGNADDQRRTSKRLPANAERDRNRRCKRQPGYAEPGYFFQNHRTSGLFPGDRQYTFLPGGRYSNQSQYRFAPGCQ